MTDRLDEVEELVAEVRRTRKYTKKFDSIEQFTALEQAANNWNITETFLADRGWPREAVTPERIAGAFKRNDNANRYDPGLPDMTEAESDT